MMLIALLTFVGRATAQTVELTAEDVVIEAGKTAELRVSLENSMDIAGWQMYLYLPENIDIVYEEEDGERYYDNTVILSSRHLRSHTCTITATDDGGYLIMGYNPSKPTKIKENSGELVTITLQAAENYSGDHTATIKNVAVSDMNSVQTNMEGEVTVHIAEARTTGLKGLKGLSGDEPVYDLNGRRMVQPSKGVNIVGGSKVVVKK